MTKQDARCPEAEAWDWLAAAFWWRAHHLEEGIRIEDDRAIVRRGICWAIGYSPNVDESWGKGHLVRRGHLSPQLARTMVLRLGHNSWPEDAEGYGERTVFCQRMAVLARKETR